jgi:histidinol-phosphate aminotransferase
MANFNLDTLIRPNIKTLKPYASARDEFKDFGKDMVFLDANENPFENGVNRYPDPQQLQLKTVISELKQIPVNQILLGNGSDEVLDLIFRAFCEPNKDNILTLPPTYGMYEVLANINAVEIISVPLNENFEPQVDIILEAANSQSKVLFLCSPNNPTANSFERQSIEKLLLNFKGLVVIDEAYSDFSEQESWLSQLDIFPNLIVIQTLSKAYGLAGIRLGMCFASAEIIAVMNLLKPPYNVNELTQQRALERLKNMAKVSDEVQNILQQRDVLLSDLKSIDFVQKVYPSDANFVLIKVDDANLRYNQLIIKGIVVRNRTNQPLCDNCLRITIGTKEENLQLINILKTL